MTQIFERCREIAASDVAQREGIVLHQRGNRAWACCPLHGENTASLMFDEVGRWHCFGCDRGGDAVDFYASLHRVSPYEAAQALTQGYDSGSLRVPIPISPAKELQDLVEEWLRREWNRAAHIKHKAAALIDAVDMKYQDCVQQNRIFALPDGFFKLVGAKAAAECRLEELLLADLHDKVAMMVEESHERS